MANKLPGMTLKAIGTVRNEIKRPSHRECTEVVSEIVIDAGLTEALDRLDEFSHIIVLYWMHKAAGGQPAARVHPRGRREAPLVGVFATRSPNRPNPVGQTTVRLLERRGNILKVKGLDAIDGSPVIDIKPYLPGYDSPADAGVAPWITICHETGH
ncbi:MAG: tRNA (N6-threonylcarbamoyladenosine(37)-N6)-methyltransferase TrmO [Chloroflexota bacterium]|nr:tRNA (N6-threonylcarbamoyladenosine(37)-N6)-methyltransferase TrmO [Chloroflexota bacterium]